MRRLATVLVVTAGLSLSGAAQAHPHAWITLQSEIEVDADGDLVALRMAWTFDAFYSNYLMRDIAARPGTEPDAALWAEKAEEFQRNLGEYDFMTELRVNGEHMPMKPAGTPRLSRQDDATLTLHLTLSPVDPVALPGSTVSYRVYDPTYYIEIRHAEADGRTFVGGGAPACRSRLIEPNPTAEAILLATALDVKQIVSDGLGRSFAERVDLFCAAQ